MKILLYSVPHLIAGCLYSILAIRTLLNFSDSHTARANKWLVGLLMTLALMLVDEFLQLNQFAIVTSASWDKFVTALNLAIGPFTYIYTRSMLMQDDESSRSALWHFCPALLFYLSLVLLLPENTLVAENTLAKTVFSLLFLATLLPYVFAALADVSAYQQGVKRRFSNLAMHDVRWVKIWLGFMVFMALVICLMPLLGNIVFLQYLAVDVHYLLIMAAVGFLLVPDLGKQQALAGNEQAAETESQQQLLPDDELNAVFKHIENVIQQQSSFLDNDLTLGRLAQQCQLAEPLVSSALNLVAGQCFYDYVNGYRVARAKNLLYQHPSRSVIDVAMASGFNAKSTFYSAFKKSVGCTPSEFRRHSERQNHRSAAGVQGKETRVSK